MASNKAGLVRLFPERAARRTYWTVWHENQRTTRRVRVVADMLEAIVREDRTLFRSQSDH